MVANATRRIEELLLVGLDHYFAGRHELAINIWTRVLFLDRSHGKARAYIERARSALAEKHRQAEELIHTGQAALDRGDHGAARRLLTSAERAGGGDEALSLLHRLDRLDAATPATARTRPSSTGCCRARSYRSGARRAMHVWRGCSPALPLACSSRHSSAVISGWWPIPSSSRSPAPALRRSASSRCRCPPGPRFVWRARAACMRKASCGRRWRCSRRARSTSVTRPASTSCARRFSASCSPPAVSVPASRQPAEQTPARRSAAGEGNRAAEMRCPKCQYISFESGDRCRNCGYEFSLSVDNEPDRREDCPRRAGILPRPRRGVHRARHAAQSAL